MDLEVLEQIYQSELRITEVSGACVEEEEEHYDIGSSWLAAIPLLWSRSVCVCERERESVY